MKTKLEKGILGYEDGVPIVAVTVKHHRQGNQLRLVACPYCGKRHLHGPPEGHRAAHCSGTLSDPRGYYLRIVGQVQL